MRALLEEFLLLKRYDVLPVERNLFIILSHSLQKLGILSPRVQWRKWSPDVKAPRGLGCICGSRITPCTSGRREALK